MTAFFLGVQKTGKGYGEIAVAVVDGVHGPDHERLSAFPRKERKLGGLMLQIGQPNPEKPHRLLKLDRIQLTFRTPPLRACAVYFFFPKNSLKSSLTKRYL